MTVTHDLSIISLISQASILVQLVMALLATLSLVSWYWIFRKSFRIRQARTETDKFERDFWSGGDLNALYESASRHQSDGMERIFEAGYREFTKLRAKGHDHGATLDGARRAMRATHQREIDDLEAHLAFLAPAGTPPGQERGLCLPPEGIDLERLTRDLIVQALERAGGNRSRAARLLGISRPTLIYRIDKHKIRC